MNRKNKYYKIIEKFWNLSLELVIKEEQKGEIFISTGLTLKEPTIFDEDEENFVGGRSVNLKNQTIIQNEEEDEEIYTKFVIDMITQTFNEMINSEVLNISIDTVKYAELMEKIKIRDKEYYK